MSTNTPEARLEALGLSLPPPPAAVANYVGLVRVGQLAFVSGHGPVENGELTFIGKLGRDMDVETGQKAAQLTMLNLLATLAAEIGGLDRVERVVKLLVMVNSTPDFAEQPFVANGASDLLVEIFGPERGLHARSAIGMGALPFGISVEIEGIFEVRE
ncbi:MAG: RidA family protein [Thermoleophilia bacterium]|nr:RidA family protein [Thermoleophilia bacterium]